MARFDGPEQLRELVLGFQTSRVLLTAFELGLFEALAAGPLSSPDLAERIGTDPRATDRLLCVLHTLGLVEKSNGLYRNTDAAERYFVLSSPDYIYGLAHLSERWNNWNDLTKAVRQGAMPERGEFTDWEPDLARNFISMLNQRGQVRASALLRHLDLRDVRSVLDLGGGSGVFSLAFTRVREDIRATVFELPNIAPLTRGYLEELDDRDAVQVLEGNFLEDDIGSGYDLILLASIIHMFDLETNARLIQKCSKALRPKGQLVIQDYIMNEDRVGPDIGAMFAIHMLVSTPRGDTYTAGEIGSWMKRAGFDSPEIHELPVGSSVMIARKAVR